MIKTKIVYLARCFERFGRYWSIISGLVQMMTLVLVAFKGTFSGIQIMLLGGTIFIITFIIAVIFGHLDFSKHGTAESDYDFGFRRTPLMMEMYKDIKEIKESVKK